MPITSAEEFVKEAERWLYKFATRPDDIDELFYKQLARMIQERDEAIRESAYQSGIDVGFESGYECGSNNIEVG